MLVFLTAVALAGSFFAQLFVMAGIELSPLSVFDRTGQRVKKFLKRIIWKNMNGVIHNVFA